MTTEYIIPSLPSGVQLGLPSGQSPGEVLPSIQYSVQTLTLFRLTGLGLAYPSIYLIGGTTPNDGLQGFFVFEPLDTTSADNGSTIIVDANGNRYYRQGVPALTGPLAVVDPSTSNTSTLHLTNTSSTTNGAGIEITGNGSTTPNKFIRVLSGVLQFLNSAYSAVIGSVTDAGLWTFPSATVTGALTANTVTSNTAGTTTGQLVSVDQLSSNSYNNTGSITTGTSVSTAITFTPRQNGVFYFWSICHTNGSEMTAPTGFTVTGGTLVYSQSSGNLGTTQSINSQGQGYATVTAGTPFTLTAQQTLATSGNAGLTVMGFFGPTL